MSSEALINVTTSSLCNIIYHNGRLYASYVNDWFRSTSKQLVQVWDLSGNAASFPKKAVGTLQANLNLGLHKSVWSRHSFEISYGELFLLVKSYGELLNVRKIDHYCNYDDVDDHHKETAARFYVFKFELRGGKVGEG